tara:strand:+ start:470 stop:871 length:402 start_codon:yes stop_codon:yes gene_type:complete
MKNVELHAYQLDFAQIKVYSNFLVTTPHMGVNVDANELDQMIAIASKHFEDRPFGTISYRIHQSSINPFNYKTISTIKNLKAIAIVGKTEFSYRNYEIEKMFVEANQKIQFFHELPPAIEWMQNELSPYLPPL